MALPKKSTSLRKRPDLSALVSRKKIQDQKAAGGSRYFKPGCPLPLMKINKQDTEYFVDVLPWVGGPNDPFAPNQWQFRMDVKIHFHDNQSFICPKHWGAHECPFCEERRRLADAGEPKEVFMADPYKMKSREIYQVVDVGSDAATAKGPQIMEASSFLMGDKIKGIEKVVARPGQKLSDEDATINYFDADNGKTLYFKTKAAPNGSGQWQSDHKFLDRNYVIEDDLLDACIDLAEWIEVKSYEELFFILHGEHPHQSEKSKVSKAQPEAEEDDQVEVSNWEEASALSKAEKVAFIMDNDIPDTEGDIVTSKQLKKMKEDELDAMLKAHFGVEDVEGDEPEEGMSLEEILEMSLEDKAQHIVDYGIADEDGNTYSSAKKVSKAFDEDEMDAMITEWFEAAE